MRVKSVQKKDPIEIIEDVCEDLVNGELVMLAEDRKQIENLIEGLISLLDSAEPDPDREPSLGWLLFPLDCQLPAAMYQGKVALWDGEPEDEGNDEYWESDLPYIPLIDISGTSCGWLHKMGCDNE